MKNFLTIVTLLLLSVAGYAQNCTTCPITGVADTAGTPNDNGTPCSELDDYLPTTITVKHQACASTTKGGKFKLIYNITGGNVVYGPYNFDAGTSTKITINLPYGTTDTVKYTVTHDSFTSCYVTEALKVPGKKFTGIPDIIPPVISCPANINVNTDTGKSYAYVTVTNPIASDNCTAYLLGTEMVKNGTFSSTTMHWTHCGNFAETNTYATFSGAQYGNNSAAEVDPHITTSTADDRILCQNVSGFIVGKTYLLSFKACRRWGTPIPLVCSAKVDGGALDTTFSRSNPTFGMVEEGFFFTATKTTHQLTFTPSVQYNAGLGMLMDDISIKQLTDLFQSSVNNPNDASGNFPIGTTPITWTAKDAAGNQSQCTHYVTVTDNEKPAITLSASTINVSTNTGTNYATGVNLGTPVTTDNHKVSSVTNNAPSQYPMGTTIVTWTVKDSSGNTTTMNQTVVVTDNQPPTGSIANITVYTDNGSNVATGVNLGTPTVTDNDGVASVTNNGGTSYPLGVSTVTWTATDNSGNTGTFTQKVTVLDNQPPTISISNTTINTNTDLGDNIATGVNLGTPTASDNNGTPTLTNDAPSSFPMGTTIVTWTATDASGNTATATQIVTVTDVEAPTGSIANITVYTDNGSTVATGVNLGTPIVSDNDEVSSVTNNGGSSYPMGNTTVTWIVTDESGNTGTFTQIVTVIDNQAPTGSIANITVYADNGSNVATGVNLGTPTVSDNDGVASVTNNGGTAYPIGNTTVTWTATDNSGNTGTFTQIVTVLDNQAPTGSIANITVYADNGSNVATGVNLGTPTVSDNDGIASVTNNGAASYPLGNTTVTWTATDNSGNSATFTQIVTVLDNQAPTISISNTTVNDNTDQGSNVATGVNLGTPTVSDNDGIASVTNDAPSSFPIGTTIVTWTVTDNSGNTATATQTVVIVDNEAPIGSIANITVYADNGSNVATGVNLGTPTVTDNDGVASVTNNGGASYPLGNTTVTWTATDNSGNTGTFTQIVTVLDNQAPTISISNTTVNDNTDPGSNVATGVNLGTPTVSDNDGIASVTNDAPSSFPIGTTIVTWTVTDNSGNTATATQTVIVVDNEAPTGSIANITVYTDNNSNVATGVNLGTPTVNDNDGIASVTNNGGTSYPMGNTTVTWTAADNSGNTVTFTQIVTVIDNVNPVANCKALTLSLTGPTTITAAQIDNGSTDNDGIATMTVSPNTFSCADAGVKTVVLTVTDNSGNVSTCTTTVTIINQAISANILVTPSNNTFTGGVPTNIYLGYGPQSATMTCNVTNGNNVTYSWSPATNLSCTNCQSPVFTPTAEGTYTYTVTATSSTGCPITKTVQFCVQDIQEYKKNGQKTGKVIVCHVPPGNPSNVQMISVSVNAVPAHVGLHGGDKLGHCDWVCGSSAKRNNNNIIAEEDHDHDHNIGNIDAHAAGISLYPNPNNGNFTLELPSKEAAQVIITNVSGQVVYKNAAEGVDKMTIKLNDVTEGLYMIQVTSGNNSYHSKVFVH